MLSLSTLLALPLVAAVVGSAVVSLVLCLHDLLRRRHSLPSLHYRESALNSRLLSRCGLRHRVFSPAFWLTSPHVQTVLAACWPRGGDGQEVTFQREYLQMRDKGVVALDWVVSVQPRVKRKATVLLVLPPVTGDAHSVSALCELATRRGFRTVVFNRRGHGTSVLTTAKLLNAADPSDLRQVIKYLRLRFPKSRLAAVSYGTGCGLLISYLGEFGSSALLSAGACVSPCYDTVDKFSGALRSVYDLVHLLKLKWILLQHAKALSAVVDVKRALLKAWSFRAYEEAVYCRMYNYVWRSDSTSRGTHPAVAVSVNGVATTASSGSSSSTLTVGKNGSGGPRCGEVSTSGALPPSSGTSNGNAVMETPGAASVSSSQSVSAAHTPGISDTMSKASQGSSRVAPQTPSSLTSSTSQVTSSILKQKPSHPVTEVLRKPSSSSSSSETVSDARKASVLDSVSDTDPAAKSECRLKSATSPRLPFVPKETSMSLSETDSVFEGSTESSPQLSSSSLVSRSRSSSTSRSKLASASVPSTLSASSAPSLPSTAASPSSPSTHSPPPSPLSSPPPPSPSSASHHNPLNPLEEYWERNNPIRDVDDIAVPVLCINSLDDPFFPTSSSSSSSSSASSSSSSSSTIPYDLFRCYPNFLLVVTEKGGHCGFLERYPFKSWADLLCLDYLEAVFELTTRGYVTTSSTTTATGNASSGTSSSSSSSNVRRNTRSTI